jgi:hypothetical protein
MAFTNLHRLDTVAKAFLKILPMVSSVDMGALSQKPAGSDMLGFPAQAQPFGLTRLSSFLDFDGDGSIADDYCDLDYKRFSGHELAVFS